MIGSIGSRAASLLFLRGRWEGERRSRIVGRDSELARAGPLLDDALAGRGRLILCTGEAGIGKTRLAEEIAAFAVAQGRPSCGPAPPTPAARPPTACGASPSTASGTRPQTISGRRWQVFARRPAPGAMSPARSDSNCSPSFVVASLMRRRNMASSSCSTISSGPTRPRSPCWPTLAASFGACGCSSSRPIRDGGTRLPEALAADTDIERVALHGLPAEAVGHLLAASGLTASPEQAADIHLQTGGNPFLVREIGRALADHEDAVPTRCSK